LRLSTDLKQRISALSDEQRRLLAQRLTKRTRAAGPATTIPRRAPELERLPLSFAQQRLWFLDQVSPLNLAFAVTEITRLAGPLDIEVFRRSVNEIVRRHEVLRTTFTVTDGEPMQTIAPSLDLDVAVEDARMLPPADRLAHVTERVAVAQRQPWSLGTGPLIRAHVWHLADDDHVVLILVHHIVSDGWSKNLLIRELATLFRAFSEGKPSPLPELPVQYGDFAVWEHEWVRGAEAQAALEYWKRQMAGAPLLQLPTERPGRPVQSTTGFHRRVLIPADVKQALKALSQRENATLFMTLFAAFAVLLSRYSGQDDIVMGSPFANRRVREVEDVIGCFMNPVPLRADLSGNPTFRQFLGRVREVAVGAYAHQGTPFDLLVRTLPHRRDAGAAPLFQVLFLLQNFDWQELDLSGSELGRRSIAVSDEDPDDAPFPGDLAYPVTLEALDYGTKCVATFEYAPEYARVFAEVPAHFRRLLETVVADPDVRIRDIAFLTEGERTRLLDEWSGHRVDYPIRPVHQLFEAQAVRTPDSVAVVSGAERVSYADLNARANRLARLLVAHGVTAECPVGLVLERSADAIAAILAVLKAGGAYVPIDPNYPSERQAFVLDDAGVRVIVTEQRLLDRLPELFARAKASSHAPAIVRLDADAAALATQGSDNLNGTGDVANLAYLIYTSGSTGRPKGTMITNAALANACFAWQDAYGLNEAADVHLQMASISFDVFSGDLVRALCSGGTLVVAPQDALFSPADLYRLMRDERVTCAEFVPAVVRGLIKYLDETEQALDFMRVMIVGSDSWFASEYASIAAHCGPRTRVINSYGVSEATIDSTFFERPALDLSPDAPMPIGRSFANTEVYVLDAALQPVVPGVHGELCIGGRGLARGYFNRPDLTAEKFVPHPFSTTPGARLYRTGDLARFLDDGSIELLGRIDTQVKLRGFRIEVGEIEAVLAQHPTVAEAVVVMREDTPGDKRLVGYAVAAAGAVVTAPDLRRYARETLPEYMVPSAIVALDALPLLPNGKIDRRALPAPEQQRQSDETFVAPGSELEKSIASVWKELLRVESVGVHDNFFDLGGHSLLVIQAHSRLRRALGREDLTVVDLFVHPTIHALAAKLDDRPGAELVELDDVRDRAARQRDAMRRRRESEAREVAG
jgi:amino acid adenylation domain-containing protein